MKYLIKGDFYETLGVVDNEEDARTLCDAFEAMGLCSWASIVSLKDARKAELEVQSVIAQYGISDNSKSIINLIKGMY